MLGLRYNLEKLDRNLAIAGIFAGMAAAPLLITTASDYIGISITLVIISTIYLIIRGKNYAWDIYSKRFNSLTSRLLINILFFGLLCYIIFLLHSNTYNRPLAYFISIALMSTVVAFEIFTMPKESKGNTTFLLTKIIVIACILRWSLYYMFPSSLFGSDPWDAVHYIQNISENGFFTYDIISMYSHMPFMHITAVFTSNIAGLDPRDSLFLSIGLIEIISLIFIFLLGSSLFNNKVGLLAMLLLAVNNLHTRWGLIVTAETLGLTLATLVLFLTFRPVKGNPMKFRIISLLVLISLIFTHHLSSLFTLVMLLFIFIGQWIYTSVSRNAEKPAGLSINTVFFFAVCFIAYSLYVTHLVDFITYVEFGGGKFKEFPILVGAVATSTLTINPVWTGLNKLGPLTFYTLAMMGIMFITNVRNMNLSRFSLAFCGALLTIFVFLIFIFPVPATLSVGRWFFFIQMVLAIPASLGLVIIGNTMMKNWRSIYLLGTITFLLVSLMIFNAQPNFDSPTNRSYLEPRLALTESEMGTAATINTVYEGTVTVDSYYTHAFKHVPQVTTKSITLSDVSTDFADVRGLILFRAYSLEDLLMLRSEKSYNRVDAASIPVTLEHNRFSQVYDSGAVQGYHKP